MDRQRPGGFRSDMPNPMIFNKKGLADRGSPEGARNASRRTTHVDLRRMGSLHILRALSPGTQVPSD